MKSILISKLAPMLLLLGLIATPVLAQQPSTTGTAAAPASPNTHTSRKAKRIDAVKQRIAQLHSELKITDQQSTQWNALAQAMRDNAREAGMRMHQLKKSSLTMNAQQNMQAYAELAQEHATNMQKLSVAFTTLYNVLSVDQKKTADILFQHRSMHHRGKHKPKPSKPAGASAN